MPIGGGASDKLGNRYEALWVVDQLLQVVEGAATSLTLELIDSDASRGIEFVVERDDGAVDAIDVAALIVQCLVESVAEWLGRHVLLMKKKKPSSMVGDSGCLNRICITDQVRRLHPQLPGGNTTQKTGNSR